MSGSGRCQGRRVVSGLWPRPWLRIVTVGSSGTGNGRARWKRSGNPGWYDGTCVRARRVRSAWRRGTCSSVRSGWIVNGLGRLSLSRRPCVGCGRVRRGLLGILIGVVVGVGVLGARSVLIGVRLARLGSWSLRRVRRTLVGCLSRRLPCRTGWVAVLVYHEDFGALRDI